MDMTQWKVAMGETSLDALDVWLAGAKDQDLYRINARRLALDLRLELPRLLEVLLRAVERGTMGLNWEYHCPHCQGIPDFKHHFGDIAGEGFCALCDVGFRNTLDTNVEVTFSPHPRYHTFPQDFVESYRSTMIEAIKTKTLVREEVFLSGFDCLNNAVYQELFGTEVLSTEETLAINRVTLLFTDIKGSTDMYSRLGDAASYRIVREHFKILFKEIEATGGYVVKTIGDAVMASFIRPEDGVRAALAAYDAFKSREWTDHGRLEIKMGLHTGPVIAVTMNDRIDYFGNTVNKSARVQAVAENHTVCFTNEILKEQGVKKVLKQWTQEKAGKVLKNTVKLKGIEGTVDFYRIAE